jgi:hypothetical protein
VINLRALWRPKRKEVPEQCKSCPFRKGNNKEFGEIIKKLGKSHGVDKPSVAVARASVKMEATQIGDFVCHLTAYNPDMTLRPKSKNLQCKGATEWFKAHGPQVPEKEEKSAALEESRRR